MEVKRREKRMKEAVHRIYIYMKILNECEFFRIKREAKGQQKFEHDQQQRVFRFTRRTSPDVLITSRIHTV